MVPAHPLNPVDAVIFDMDGTLVDSEHLTRDVVNAACAEAGVDGDAFPDEKLHGVTWDQIATDLRALFPVLDVTGRHLHERCHALAVAQPPHPIPGVLRALAAAQDAGLSLALATSSNREAADSLLARPGFEPLTVRVTADDITHSKPDPEIFLLAATKLGVAPERCLVFEDSLAGLRAANAAGMQSVAVLHSCADPTIARGLSTLAIVDYTQLPASFFADLRRAMSD